MCTVSVCSSGILFSIDRGQKMTSKLYVLPNKKKVKNFFYLFIYLLLLYYKTSFHSLCQQASIYYDVGVSCPDSLG